MAMPDEHSVFCDECGSFNIQCGDYIVVDGKTYCDDCVDFKKIKKLLKIGGKRR